MFERYKEANSALILGITSEQEIRALQLSEGMFIAIIYIHTNCQMFYNLILKNCPKFHRTKFQTNHRLTSSTPWRITIQSVCTIIHILLFNKVSGKHYLQRPSIPHVLLVYDAATTLESLLWNFLQQPSTCWWLPFNHFTTGGNAMPKIYCTFTKDPVRLRHYVPHSAGSRPLLAYRAQAIQQFPLASAFDVILQRYGFTNWNYVTIVLYAGKQSGISSHRDRQQVAGFDSGNEQIASFVFGDRR